MPNSPSQFKSEKPTTVVSRMLFVQSHWNYVTVTAASVLAIVTTIAAPPPLLEDDSTSIEWYSYVRFLAIALLGLWFVPMRIYDSRKDARAWWLSGALLLLCGIGTLILHANHLDRWQVSYAKPKADKPIRRIVGEPHEVKEEVKNSDLYKNSQAIRGSSKRLLEEVAGNAEQVWPVNLLRSHARAVAWSYTLSILLFFSALISIGQANYCITRASSNTSRQKPKRKTSLTTVAFLCLNIACVHTRVIAQPSSYTFSPNNLSQEQASLEAGEPLSPLDFGNDLFVQIKKEIEKLDKREKLHTDVWQAKGTERLAESHIKVGIIIYPEQFANLRQRLSKELFQATVLWLIAHEHVHQLQFRNINKRYSSSETKRILECQADILAAKYLRETLLSEGTIREQQFAEATRVAFALGQEQAHLSDHPSRLARLKAVQLGLLAGNSKHVLADESRGIPETFAFDNQNLLLIDHRFTDTSWLDWSERWAKRIVGISQEALANIVYCQSNYARIHQPEFRYGKGFVECNLDTSLLYLNIGNRPILVDLVVEVLGRPDTISREDLSWKAASNIKMIGASYHQFRIEPHSSYRVKLPKLIEWDWENNKGIDLYVSFPPDDRELISASFADTLSTLSPKNIPLAEMTNSTAVTKRGIGDGNWQDTLVHAEYLPATLSWLLNATADSVMHWRRGPGYINSIDLKKSYNSCYTFRLAYALSGSDSTYLELPINGKGRRKSEKAHIPIHDAITVNTNIITTENKLLFSKRKAKIIADIISAQPNWTYNFAVTALTKDSVCKFYDNEGMQRVALRYGHKKIGTEEGVNPVFIRRRPDHEYFISLSISIYENAKKYLFENMLRRVLKL